MKKTVKISVALCVFLVAHNIYGQTEVNVSVGTSHFLGDLGGKPAFGTNDVSDLNWKSTRYMAGVGLRQNLGSRLAVRGSAYYARVAADDKYTGNTERHMRNLNFFSAVYGGDAVLEWKFGNGIRTFTDRNWFLYAGIGYFWFNPKTRYNGNKVALQPLGTEGQYFIAGKSPYALHSLAIPFGLGYKFRATRLGYLSFQIEGRKTFTDYIDDVSTQYADPTLLLASNGPDAVALADRSNPDGRIPGFSDPGAIRGNPNNNDNFFFLTVSYNVVLGQNKSSTSQRRHTVILNKGQRKGCGTF